MITSKIKDGKLREHCVKCGIKLIVPTREGFCNKCRVIEFNAKNNQDIKLNKFFN